MSNGGDSWEFRALAALAVPFVVFKDDRVVFASDALLDLLRRSRAEMIGTNPYAFIRSEDAAVVQTRHGARLRGDAAPSDYEVTLIRSDGSPVRVEIIPRVLATNETLVQIRSVEPQLRDRELLLSLGALQARVQRERAVDAVVKTAVDGLGALGFGAGVVKLENGRLSTLAYTLSSTMLPLVQAMPFPGIGTGSGALTEMPLMAATIAEGQPRFIDDLVGALIERGRLLGETPVPLGEYRPLVERLRMLMAPLKVGATVWGMLVAAGEGLRANDAAALSLFASQIGAMIEVAQSLEETARRNRTLEAIGRVASLSVMERRPLIQELLLRVQLDTESDASALYQLDASGNELTLLGTSPSPSALGDRFKRIPVTRTVTGEAALGQHAVAISLEQWPEPTREFVRSEGIVQSAIIPLMVDGKLRGTVNLSRKVNRAYTPEELRSAEMLVAQVALQLERSRLFEDLRRSYEELSIAQQELVKRERLAALGELSAVVAHEVRNPLGVIFNSIASLRRVGVTAEKEKILAIVQEEAERLNRMVSDLLDFARPSEARMRPESIKTVITSAVDAANRALSSPHVTVDSDVAEDLPRIPLDADMIRQALINLVVNAVQAMPKGGHVKVTARLVEKSGARFAALQVVDDGPGMPREVADQVFQPFFTTRAAGTGLGLAVVKRIADAHHADVTVETAPGRGSTFSLFLPLVQPGQG